jgi:hypothetical protein
VTFPTPYLLHVKRYDPDGTKDRRGNAVPGYDPAVAWEVHSITPGAMEEPGETNRDLSVIAYTVLAPADGLVPGERDLVVYDGLDYQINGRPADWSQAAPWSSTLNAPIAVELKRFEG